MSLCPFPVQARSDIIRGIQYTSSSKYKKLSDKLGVSREECLLRQGVSPNEKRKNRERRDGLLLGNSDLIFNVSLSIKVCDIPQFLLVESRPNILHGKVCSGKDGVFRIVTTTQDLASTATGLKPRAELRMPLTNNLCSFETVSRP